MGKNRNNVRRAFRFYWIFCALVFIGLFIVVLSIPSKDLPDEVDDGMGGKNKLDDKKKKNLKLILLSVIFIAGIFLTWIQYYFYRVSVRWSTNESLISDVPDE